MVRKAFTNADLMTVMTNTILMLKDPLNNLVWTRGWCGMGKPASIPDKAPKQKPSGAYASTRMTYDQFLDATSQPHAIQ